MPGFNLLKLVAPFIVPSPQSHADSRHAKQYVMLKAQAPEPDQLRPDQSFATLQNEQP